MPTIIDRLFNKVVYTTSNLIGMDSGVLGSHEVVEPSDSKNYMAKWHQFSLFSDPHITKYSYIKLSI